MTATIHLTTEGDFDPGFCGSCRSPIGEVGLDVRMGIDSVFVPYVLIPDCDAPDELIGYDLDCAVQHCGVVLEVRG